MQAGDHVQKVGDPSKNGHILRMGAGLVAVQLTASEGCDIVYGPLEDWEEVPSGGPSQVPPQPAPQGLPPQTALQPPQPVQVEVPISPKFPGRGVIKEREGGN